MLPLHANTLRLFLHIFAATIWVGGQIVLAAVVPIVRRFGGKEATRAVARQFQRVAWPAFGLLVATGIWNLASVHVADQSNGYYTSLFVKLLLVFVSGAGALGHTILTRTRPALGGALAGVALLAAIAAMLIGVQLHLV